MKYRLGDICTIVKGETGIMKAIPGEFAMVTTGEENKTHNEFKFDTKAVIIPLVSSTGHGHASMKRVKFQEGKFALGSILCAVIPKDDSFVLAKYLHIYLHWNREELLVSQMKGMANVSLSLGKIADVEVIVPSFERQQYIVELESKLVAQELEADKLFADQLTQIENLNQAILQEAVQGKLVAQNPEDEPARELVKRIKAEKSKAGKKEKPLPPIKPEEIPFEIPENWVWCRLGEIIDLISGQHIDAKDHNADGNGYPYLTGPSDFGTLFPTPTRWTTKPKVFAELGDILVTVKGSGVGKINYSNIHKVAISRQLMAIRAISANKEFLFSYLDYSYSLLQLKKKGTGIPGIGREDINHLKIPLPPLLEQTRIVAEIEKQIAKTKQLKDHIIANQHATEQLLKGLLHQAFEVEELVEAEVLEMV